jgi:GTP cyclohydrolase IA
MFIDHTPADHKALFCDDVKRGFENILHSLEKHAGINRFDGNFKDTPARVAKAYGEILDGMFGWEFVMADILSKTFPSKSSEMVTVGPIHVWSICPHHFLPVDMKVWVGYIPNKKVLGLSKLARIAELLAKKPALQEDTTCEIAQALQKGLKPKGAACIIKGRHLCMEMRGVKKTAVTTTTSLEGVFLKPEVRAEFLAAVRGDR